MAEDKSHKTAANRIAKKLGTTAQTEGPDIKTQKITIEVETPGGMQEGIRQLQGSRGPVYLAGTNKKAVQEAVDATQNTTIGVMDNQGNILKESTRKR